MAMRFYVNINGIPKQYITISTKLREGFFQAESEEKKIVTFSRLKFENIIDKYINDFESAGVIGHVFSFEDSNVYEYYYLTNQQIKDNKDCIYSFSTDGKYLSLTFRVSKKEKDFLRNNALRVQETEKTKIYDLIEIFPYNQGFLAEKILFDKCEFTHSPVDGTIDINGINTAVQLKSSYRNKSRSRSKSANIWSARKVGNFIFD